MNQIFVIQLKRFEGVHGGKINRSSEFEMLELSSYMYKSAQKHICRVCGRSFPTGISLGGHMKTHVVQSSLMDNDKDKPSASIYGLRDNPEKSWLFDSMILMEEEVEEWMEEEDEDWMEEGKEHQDLIDEDEVSSSAADCMDIDELINCSGMTEMEVEYNENLQDIDSYEDFMDIYQDSTYSSSMSGVEGEYIDMMDASYDNFFMKMEWTTQSLLVY